MRGQWGQRHKWCVAAVFLLVLSSLLSAAAQESELVEVRGLNEQIFRYYAKRQYKQAIPLAQRALSITNKELGSNHPETAASLNNLGMLYFKIGAYAEAQPLYERALVIRERVLGHEHPDTVVSISNLAGLLLAIADYTHAELLDQRALAITEKTQGFAHPATALSLNNLAELYQTIGSYAKAEQLYRRALAINENVFGPKHPYTAISLNNLAEIYRLTGDYVKAELLYLRSIAIKEQVLGPDHPDLVVTLGSLATVYQVTGSYAKAEAMFQRALAIAEKSSGPDDLNTARAANNLGHLYFAMLAYGKAELLYQRALAIFEHVLGRKHPNVAVCLNNLAELYRASGAYAKAEPFYQRALMIKEEAFGPEHPETAVSLNNLAGFYFNTGAYARATAPYERALAIREKALGSEHIETAQSINNLAALYQATGAYAQAEPLLERAQHIYEVNTARFLLSGDELRKREYVQRHLGNAYANASFSLAVADPRARALGLTEVLQYKGRVLDAMTDSVAVLRHSVDPEDQALFDKLAAVAQQFSTLTFRGPGNLSTQAYREQLDALAKDQERLEGDLSQRSAAFRQFATPITLESVRQALPADAALVEWFRYHPFDPKARDERQRSAAAHYVAYVLRRDGDPAAIDFGAAEEIDKLISEFRIALSDPSNTSYKQVAQDLFGKLVKPLTTSLSGVNRLLLSPDGQLNLLPFAALINDHGGYVTQEFEITYLTSGRDVLTMRPEPARGGPVVMANPDYGQTTSGPPTNLASYRSSELDRSGLVFTPLAGTAGEADALQELLKLDAQEVLTGTNATEEKLRGLHGPRILHVATHGFFLSDEQVAAAALLPVSFGAIPLPPITENPLLRSGLALAGANARRSGENDDGILTAAEAERLDLRGTQLVVLSACETGLGQVQQGEGVYGLRRALVLAGAQALLVSLWKVADAQTKVMMVDYYERLLKGEGRSAALREAQKAMIANPATQHPYYWAAFFAIGSWTPLGVGSMEQPK